tara:strand:+ start:192 stop:419 length:228 start_codon:yes stop_codon:yes gene_type:complete
VGKNRVRENRSTLIGPGEKLNLKTPAVSSFDIFDFRVQFFEDRESIHVCVEVDEVDNVEVSMFFWATTNTLTQPF